MRQDLDILVPAARIEARVAELSEEIAGWLEPDSVVVGLLQGAFLFMADMMRGLARAGATPRTDFLWLSSYGDARESGGRVQVLADLQKSVEGRKVLLVDDVYDTGRTIAFARDCMRAKGAAETRACLLARKPSALHLPPPEHLGFDLPDRFLVGYGLDDGGRGRGLPDLCAVRLPAPG